MAEGKIDHSRERNTLHHRQLPRDAGVVWGSRHALWAHIALLLITIGLVRTGASVQTPPERPAPAAAASPPPKRADSQKKPAAAIDPSHSPMITNTSEEATIPASDDPISNEIHERGRLVQAMTVTLHSVGSRSPENRVYHFTVKTPNGLQSFDVPNGRKWPTGYRPGPGDRAKIRYVVTKEGTHIVTGMESIR